MKILKTTSFYLLAFALVSLLSCERDEDPQGPLLLDLYGEFELIEPLSSSRNQVDFSSQTVIFNAEFNKLTDWQLTITGSESGAIKILSDLSRDINVLNGEWDGTTTIFPVFQEEVCYVDLFIPEDSLHMYDTITITGTRNVQGTLIENFDNGFNTGWTVAPQAGGFISINTDSNIIQGSGNLNIGGFIQFNEFLVAQYIIPASAYDMDHFPLQSDPSSLYFNMLLYVPQENSGGFLLFNFYEDDNNNGTYENTDDVKEDVYGWEIQNEDLPKGWSILSLRYSRLEDLAGGEAIGNNILEPNLLNNIELLYLHPPMQNYSEISIDYIIFTTGEPLKL